MSPLFVFASGAVTVEWSGSNIEAVRRDREQLGHFLIILLSVDDSDCVCFVAGCVFVSTPRSSTSLTDSPPLPKKKMELVKQRRHSLGCQLFLCPVIHLLPTDVLRRSQEPPHQNRQQTN